MNNAIKIKIYPKKWQNISLDWLFDMMYETKVSLSTWLVYVYHTSYKLNKYIKQFISPGV